MIPVSSCVRLVVVAAAVLAAGSARAQSPAASPSPDYLGRARDILAGRDRDKILAQIREMYEQAKASGERVPADLWTWVREDVARAGGWEYRVVRGEKDPERLEAQLNALGRERWECVTLRETGRADAMLVLKRPVKSYLGDLNVRDVLRVMPSN
jgi:hypothetical protein